jgi:Ca2+-binding RTX toxin-like protein
MLHRWTNQVCGGTAMGILFIGTNGTDTIRPGTISGGVFPSSGSFSGNDIINGLNGNDVLDGGTGADLIDGGADDDDIYVGTGDIALGNIGNDTFFVTGNAPDLIDGGFGTDTLDAQGDYDLTTATISGVEELAVSGARVRLTPAQLDTFTWIVPDLPATRGVIELTQGGTANVEVMLLDELEVTGSAFSDTLTLESHVFVTDIEVHAGYGNDTITTGDGDDLIFGEVGEDRLEGGDGDDTLWGGSHDDDLYGGEGTDRLHGEGEGDYMDGGGGDDFLWVGLNDRADGGGGDDVFFVEQDFPLILDGGTGSDTLDPLGTRDLGFAAVVNFEKLAASGSTLTLTASALDDFTTIEADDGATIGRLRLNEGGTATAGVVGLERLEVTGSADADILTLGSADSTDIEIAGMGGGDILTTGDGDDTLEGGAGDDTLRGADGWDELIGGADEDRLEGGAGNDTLRGGDDDDQLLGGTGTDTASYVSAPGVTVSLAIVGFQDTGSVGLDRLVSIENLTGSAAADTLTGNTGANTLLGGAGGDVLTGGGGADQLLGQAGNDVLAGEASNDELTGGSGKDDFVFGPGGGTDLILDFADGLDQIAFEGFGLDFDSSAEIMARASQLGADVRISLPDPGAGPNTVVRILNFDVADLTSADFAYVIA